ncbi:hypothetical protein KX478_25070 [Escherichia coli]|nr:hypothetical protein [Escherichia coli]
MKIFSITPDRKNTTTGGGVSLGRLYLIRAIAFLSVRIPLYSITDWHRSPISDSHPFDQPGT